VQGVLERRLRNAPLSIAVLAAVASRADGYASLGDAGQPLKRGSWLTRPLDGHGSASAASGSGSGADSDSSGSGDSGTDSGSDGSRSGSDADQDRSPVKPHAEDSTR
jgi:hypothetical protein